MADDYCGDIVVDAEKPMETCREWVEETNPAPGPSGLRRPTWFERPIALPTDPGTDVWYLTGRSERWDPDTRSPTGVEPSATGDD